MTIRNGFKYIENKITPWLLKPWSFSGFVVDDRTGERIVNASVYEKRLLQATLTDEHGYFKLRFRAQNDRFMQLTLGKRHND